MKTVSLELSKKLYDLSGWGDTQKNCMTLMAQARAESDRMLMFKRKPFYPTPINRKEYRKLLIALKNSRRIDKNAQYIKTFQKALDYKNKKGNQ